MTFWGEKRVRAGPLRAPFVMVMRWLGCCEPDVHTSDDYDRSMIGDNYIGKLSVRPLYRIPEPRFVLCLRPGGTTGVHCLNSSSIVRGCEAFCDY